MKKNSHKKAIIVGIVSGLATIVTLQLDLNTWLTFTVIAIIVFLIATIVDHFISD